MAETAAQGDNTASQPGKAKQLILLGAFVAHLIVLGGSLGVIYKMTLGWQPPVTREEELRQILKDREKLIEKGRHPQNDIIELVEKDLAVDALSVPFDEIVTNLNGLPSRMIKMQLYFKVLDEYTFQLIATPPRKVSFSLTLLRLFAFAPGHALHGSSCKGLRPWPSMVQRPPGERKSLRRYYQSTT
jgi:hypothetical protein